MRNSKRENRQNSKLKTTIKKLKFLILTFGFAFCVLNFTLTCQAQSNDLEFTLDLNSETTPLPQVFQPNIDLSGRGFHRNNTWPQTLAAPEALEIWQKDFAFSGMYRLQYNLWEINQLAKDKEAQDKLLANHEEVIKKISDAGGIVILDLFGTPAGLGKVLDKKSQPWDLRAFKELVKGHIRNLSCGKKYNIWYEVWTAPDADDFFLGRRQDYLNLYRAVAESVKELEAETKVHILVGGPSVSWWFQDVDGNSIVTPERSLVYELIRFCYHYRLPLDFVSWHAYSTDPKAEKEITSYKKTAPALIRDWLSYFHFPQDTPLIVDEWNYDSGANVLAERQEKSNICASYIPARLKNMSEAGIKYQLYFSLEDFQNNKEKVVRNVGAFWVDAESSEYKGGPKAVYNTFRMLGNLGKEMFGSSLKSNDEFVGSLAAKKDGKISIIFYNYIDPQIQMNYLSRNLGSLNNAERKTLLSIINSGKLIKIMRGELDLTSLRLTNKVRGLLKKARELNDEALKFKAAPRNLKFSIKNLKENYAYQRYVIDTSCSLNCKFAPTEEKDVAAGGLYEETLVLNPYSVQMIVLSPKPKEEQTPPVPAAQQPAKEQASVSATSVPAATEASVSPPTGQPDKEQAGPNPETSVPAGEGSSKRGL